MLGWNWSEFGICYSWNSGKRLLESWNHSEGEVGVGVNFVLSKLELGWNCENSVEMSLKPTKVPFTYT